MGYETCSIKLSERDGVHVLSRCLVGIDCVRSAWLNRNSLGIDLGFLFLGLSLERVILANAIDEGLSALRLTDVLNADVNALGDDAGVHALVHDHTDGMLSHIEHLAGLAVVELVRNALLDATVSDNINIVSLSVVGKQSGEWRGSMASERFGEQVSRFTPLTFTVRHLSLNLPII